MKLTVILNQLYMLTKTHVFFSFFFISKDAIGNAAIVYICQVVEMA
jgi:hypothetical protein